MPEPTSPAVFASGLTSPDLNHLKKVHKELVDTIDQLTRNEVDKFVDLPQIIVIGDQSSGKSSVLESISHVRFPSDKSVCTRFATQLILSEADEPSMEVTIIPDEKASEAERRQLKLFHIVQEGHDDLASIIKKATQAMGLNSFNRGGALYSMHTLRVEASGPKMPRLTLVDLPGFYSGLSNDQSDIHRDMPVNIANKYIYQKNVLMLMVVSADLTTARQSVASVVKRADSLGLRRLGIITKPDLIHYDNEEEFIKYLKNEPGTDMYAEHGWHIVRNRASNEPENFEYRDEREAVELEKQPWRAISSKDKGITSLKEKLRSALVNLVAAAMPRVVRTLEDLRIEKQVYRESFRDRSSYMAIEIYLNQVQRRFSQLATQAVRGQLDDPDFFAHPSPDDAVIKRRNLRGRIRRNNREFVDVIHLCGSLNVFDWTQFPKQSPDEKDPEPVLQPIMSKYMTKVDLNTKQLELVEKYYANQPTPLTQVELQNMIKQKAEIYEGMELPGSIHQGLALRMFRDQSKPWESLSRTYINNCLEIVEDVVMDILNHATLGDKVLFDRINEKFISPFLKKRKDVLFSKLKELLPSQDQNSFPIALEDIFETQSNARGKERIHHHVTWFKAAYPKELSPGFERSLKNTNYGQAVLNVLNGTKHGSEIPRMVENLVDYYEMTLDTFVSNLIILGNENQLMVQIPEVFTMDGIINLGQEEVFKLGAEPSDIREKREVVEKELQQLDKGIELCKKWKKGATNDIFVIPKEDRVNGSTKEGDNSIVEAFGDVGVADS